MITPGQWFASTAKSEGFRPLSCTPSIVIGSFGFTAGLESRAVKGPLVAPVAAKTVLGKIIGLGPKPSALATGVGVGLGVGVALGVGAEVGAGVGVAV